MSAATRRFGTRAIRTLTGALPLLFATVVLAQELPTDRLIVKLRDGAAARARGLDQQRMDGLSARARVSLRQVRAMSGGAQVLGLPARVAEADAEAIAQRLRDDPNVEYAEPDRRVRAQLVPNDPSYTLQWHYQSYLPPDSENGGVNLPAAWDLTTGSPDVVVAVIDTGMRPHADLDGDILDGVGRVVPGYDFVSEDSPGVYLAANDGDGRDADPSDPGDWITAAEDDGSAAGGRFLNCADPAPGGQVDDSSWHGTHVAGTIGALSDNGLGVAGVDWQAKILPVRVLGKCGGYVSDIADGVRWAVGLPVPGAPANPHPAAVLNLSLGGPGPCGAAWQDAFDDAAAAGASVVVSAGNDNLDAVGFAPANCNGVMTVAAITRLAHKTSYSNFGSLIDIAAPGGDGTTVNRVLSLENTGTTTPDPSPAGDTYGYKRGTSMAAPHVSGVIALVRSIAPGLTPAQILATLQATARPFPPASNCSTLFDCGAGILDAGAAVEAATHTLDAYHCLRTKDLKDPRFVATALSLTDQFGTGVAEVRKPFLVCNPAAMNGSGITHPADHLTCYKIKADDPLPAPHLAVVNAFGSSELSIRKPFLLCVPGAKTVVP